jgi:hypothetical protein
MVFCPKPNKYDGGWGEPSIPARPQGLAESGVVVDYYSARVLRNISLVPRWALEILLLQSVASPSCRCVLCAFAQTLPGPTISWLCPAGVRTSRSPDISTSHISRANHSEAVGRTAANLSDETVVPVAELLAA